MELNLKTLSVIGSNKNKSAILNYLLRILGSQCCDDISHRCDMTELYHYSKDGTEVFISRPHESEDICIAEMKPSMRQIIESPEYEYVRASMKARGFNNGFSADDFFLSGEHRELFKLTIVRFLNN